MRASRILMDKLNSAWQAEREWDMQKACIEALNVYFEANEKRNDPFSMDVHYVEETRGINRIDFDKLPTFTRKEIIEAQLERLTELKTTFLEDENYEEVARIRTIYKRLLDEYRLL